ncbi:DUF4238 domain-containing protein [Shewanella baltica]|uniref:DUF4238 domain-containing protein n=1 Tax=Shewanella baltica TaxID=62322 RepID=UPI003D076E85
MSLDKKRDNHFVPVMYLKNWSISRKVQVYRTLVQHENVPIWKPFPLNGIGYLRNLYINTKDGEECDMLETWFDQHYEVPAEASIAKVISNSKLTPSDYKNLINFFALQDLRTPKKFIEHLNKDDKVDFEVMMKDVVERTMPKGVPRSFEPSGEYKFHDELPLKLQITKDDKGFMVSVEKLVGRASWLWSIKHLLTNVSSHLHEHKWTILHPAKGESWYTSDNPVLKLNHFGKDGYDLKGGWGNAGTELILPLGPQHLLYTLVGQKPPLPRGTSVSMEKTNVINRMLVENSHRYVISDNQCPKIGSFHERLVLPEEVKYELSQWKSLNEQHAYSEKEFYSTKYA